ncbi:hypothetical protein BASA50_008473 [Batrachochytrium salamandrivorans]|uniref:Alpha N-terminal protein methyltransferase 1 n=1 Tax=Batrachochytrium salamandrivorans TaxID=1357716 RepID=A0ABQ8F455_9FUNG|nr:hypothetical protein BASA50_008473 [Batrachochytrium salamandrivorans]KAH9267010.1 hypothetical protein BASA83_010208 [Batrachochytrium salamandrivorans]
MMANTKTKNGTPPDEWYTDAANYWESVEPTVQGMLGGFGFLTTIDAKASLEFIDEFVTPKTVGCSPVLSTTMACDCGAGIGRVSESFLLNVFDKVDLVEQNPQFLETAQDNFTKAGMAHRVDSYIALGLQEFEPKSGVYDLIWCQWVLGHLKDDDLIDFFKRCKKGLKPGGMIGLKENIAKHGILVDQEDSSVTRSDVVFRDLIDRAGLKIIKEQLQIGFPKELFAVKMFMVC